VVRAGATRTADTVNPAVITAICTGVVGVLGAVTALVKAIQAGKKADKANSRIDDIKKEKA
jgi:hypothetical protein